MEIHTWSLLNASGESLRMNSTFRIRFLALNVTNLTSFVELLRNFFKSKIPGTRRYLKLYTTMPLSKLASFMDVSDSELLSLLMAAKCKLKNSTDNYDEQNEDFLHPEVKIAYLLRKRFCSQIKQITSKIS